MKVSFKMTAGGIKRDLISYTDSKAGKQIVYIVYSVHCLWLVCLDFKLLEIFLPGSRTM